MTSGGAVSPDDHWVSAWQIAAGSGHGALDAAERMLARTWLLSAEDLGITGDALNSAEYVEVLPVALFWNGLPGSPVTTCVLSTLSHLCNHRPDVQVFNFEGFGEGTNPSMHLGIFQMGGEVLSRLVESVAAGVEVISLVSAGSSGALFPTGSEVFSVYELPANLQGGVCASLNGPEGGLAMQVQGMALNDEPYHSGDESASMDIRALQAALFPMRALPAVPIARPRATGAAKRAMGPDRSLLVKTAAVPLIGGMAPPAKALGRSLTAEASSRAKRSPRVKEPSSEMVEIQSMLRHLVSRVDSLETGGIQSTQSVAVVPSLLATGRVPPPPGAPR
eukprot:6457047-Amphidinium_carterae.1